MQLQPMSVFGPDITYLSIEAMEIIEDKLDQSRGFGILPPSLEFPQNLILAAQTPILYIRNPENLNPSPKP